MVTSTILLVAEATLLLACHIFYPTTLPHCLQLCTTEFHANSLILSIACPDLLGSSSSSSFSNYTGVVGSNNIPLTLGSTVWNVNNIAGFTPGDVVSIAWTGNVGDAMIGVVTSVNYSGLTITVNATSTTGQVGIPWTPWTFTLLSLPSSISSVGSSSLSSPSFGIGSNIASSLAIYPSPSTEFYVNNTGITSVTNTPPTQPYVVACVSELSTYVASMTHVTSAGNTAWMIRIGTSGQIYSLIDSTGHEFMGPTTQGESGQWQDRVWQWDPASYTNALLMSPFNAQENTYQLQAGSYSNYINTTCTYAPDYGKLLHQQFIAPNKTLHLWSLMSLAGARETSTDFPYFKGYDVDSIMQTSIRDLGDIGSTLTGFEVTFVFTQFGPQVLEQWGIFDVFNFSSYYRFDSNSNSPLGYSLIPSINDGSGSFYEGWTAFSPSLNGSGPTLTIVTSFAGGLFGGLFETGGTENSIFPGQTVAYRCYFLFSTLGVNDTAAVALALTQNYSLFSNLSLTLTTSTPLYQNCTVLSLTCSFWTLSQPSFFPVPILVVQALATSTVFVTTDPYIIPPILTNQLVSNSLAPVSRVLDFIGWGVKYTAETSSPPCSGMVLLSTLLSYPDYSDPTFLGVDVWVVGNNYSYNCNSNAHNLNTSRTTPPTFISTGRFSDPSPLTHITKLVSPAASYITSNASLVFPANVSEALFFAQSIVGYVPTDPTFTPRWALKVDNNGRIYSLTDQTGTQMIAGGSTFSPGLTSPNSTVLATFVDYWNYQTHLITASNFSILQTTVRDTGDFGQYAVGHGVEVTWAVTNAISTPINISTPLLPLVSMYRWDSVMGGSFVPASSGSLSSSVYGGWSAFASTNNSPTYVMAIVVPNGTYSSAVNATIGSGQTYFYRFHLVFSNNGFTELAARANSIVTGGFTSSGVANFTSVSATLHCNSLDLYGLPCLFFGVKNPINGISVPITVSVSALGVSFVSTSLVGAVAFVGWGLNSTATPMPLNMVLLSSLYPPSLVQLNNTDAWVFPNVHSRCGGTGYPPICVFPVVNLPLDGPSTILDYMHHSNTRVGTVVTSNAYGSPWTGTSNYSLTTLIVNPPISWTVCFWVYPDRANGTVQISWSGGGVQLMNSSLTLLSAGTATLIPTQWSFIVASYNASTTTQFLLINNSIVSSSTSSNGTSTNSFMVNIGLPSLVRWVQYYAFAFTTRQATDLFNSQILRPSSPPTSDTATNVVLPQPPPYNPWNASQYFPLGGNASDSLNQLNALSTLGTNCPSPFSTVVLPDGTTGQAFNFDCSNACSSVPMTANFTIAMWYQLTTPGIGVMFEVFSATALIQLSLQIPNFGVGQLNSFVANDTSGSYLAYSPVNLPGLSGLQWVHYVLSYDGLTYSKYVNGALLSSASDTTQTWQHSGAFLSPCFFESLSGFAYHLYLWNYSLSVATVAALYETEAPNIPIVLLPNPWNATQVFPLSTNFLDSVVSNAPAFPDDLPCLSSNPFPYVQLPSTQFGNALNTTCNTYITTPGNVPTSNTFSVAIWVLAFNTTTPSTWYLFGSGPGGRNDGFASFVCTIDVGLLSGGAYYCEFQNATYQTSGRVGNSVGLGFSWNHVAFSFDGLTMTSYYNSVPSRYNDTSGIWLGLQHVNLVLSQNWNGLLWHAYYWNYCVSASTIGLLYSTESNLPCINGLAGSYCHGCLASNSTWWSCSSCASNYTLNGNNQCVSAYTNSSPSPSSSSISSSAFSSSSSSYSSPCQLGGLAGSGCVNCSSTNATTWNCSSCASGFILNTTSQQCAATNCTTIPAGLPGQVVCAADYGVSSSTNAFINAVAIQEAVNTALTYPSSTLVFGAGAVYNTTMNNVMVINFNRLNQSFVLEGNNCTFRVISDGLTIPWGYFINAQGSVGNNHSLTLRNYVINVVNPAVAQGYYIGRINATAWEFQSSGLIADPVNNSAPLGPYITVFNPSLTTFTDIQGGGPGASLTVISSNGTYVLSIPNYPALAGLYPGAPVAFELDYSSAGGSGGGQGFDIYFVDNTVLSNIQVYAAGMGTLYIVGNVTADRVVMKRGSNSWLASTGGMSVDVVYGSVSVTNSWFEWATDDMLDISNEFDVIHSPINSSVSPVITSSSTSITIWANSFDQLTGIASLSRRYLRSAAGNYVVDPTGNPFTYYVSVLNQSSTVGNPGYVINGWTGTVYSYLVLTGSVAAISVLPQDATLNNYIIEVALPTTLFVSNTTFGPGMSTGVYPGFTQSSVITNCSFINLIQGGVSTQTVDYGCGPQVTNMLVENSYFYREWDIAYPPGNPCTSYPAIDLFTPVAPYQNTPSSAGATLNVTISNNVFQYPGMFTYPCSATSQGSIIDAGGAQGLNIFNNVFTMNKTALRGYAIYLQNSNNVNMCNNTFSGAPNGNVYSDYSSTNLTNCSQPFINQYNPNSNTSSQYAWNLPLQSNFMDAVYPTSSATVIGSGCSPTFGQYGGQQGVYIPCTTVNLAVLYNTMPVNYTVAVWMMLDWNATYGNNYFINSINSNVYFTLVLDDRSSGGPVFGLVYPSTVFVALSGIASTNVTGWHQYTITYTDTTSLYSLYFDGGFLYSITYSSTWSSIARPNLVLGDSINPIYFANFSCLSYALNTTQVLQSYLSNASPCFNSSLVGSYCYGCVASSLTQWSCASCGANSNFNSFGQCVSLEFMLPLQTTLAEIVTGVNATDTNGTPQYSVIGNRSSAWTDNSDYILCPSGSMYYLQQSYSEMLWVYISAPGGTYPSVVVSSSNHAASTSFFTQISAAGVIQFGHGTNTNGIASYPMPGGVYLSRWMHIAVSFNSTTNLASIYLNGTLVTSQSTNATWSGGLVRIQLGYQIGISVPLKGALNCFTWYNYEVTPTQVMAKFQSENWSGGCSL